MTDRYPYLFIMSFIPDLIFGFATEDIFQDLDDSEKELHRSSE